MLISSIIKLFFLSFISIAFFVIFLQQKNVNQLCAIWIALTEVRLFFALLPCKKEQNSSIE